MLRERLATLGKALAAQILGLSLTIGLMIWQAEYFNTLWSALIMVSILTPLSAYLLGQPRWWLLIHALFWPMVAAVLSLDLPVWLFPSLLCLSALIFWGTVSGDVPLFLSSSNVAKAVINIVEREQALHFADLGAGTGSVAIPIAQTYPAVHVTAYEHAPIPWLITAWRGRNMKNISVLRSNFWRADLSVYDVVFAFLSPAVMPTLADKMRINMRPGSLLVSSSFPILDWTPESVLTIADQPQTRLFCYRVSERC